MNATRSQIFMLSSADWMPGKCAICDVITILKFRDTSTGFVMGDCCLQSAIKAEQALFSTEGFRHPSIEESNCLPNH